MRGPHAVLLATTVAAVLGSCGAGAGDAASLEGRASGSPVAGSPSAQPFASQPVGPSLAPSPSPDALVRTPAATATAAAPARASASPAAGAGCLKNEKQDVFLGEVLEAIRHGDREAVRDRMARSFLYMVEATDVGLDPVTPRVAARQLFTGVPDPEGRTWFVPVGRRERVRCADSYLPRDLGASRGFWPTQWDVVVEVTGLGADGDATRWLMLGTNAAGQPVWQGLLFGFPGIDLLE